MDFEYQDCIMREIRLQIKRNLPTGRQAGFF